jgi:hypothetical protein
MEDAVQLCSTELVAPRQASLDFLENCNEISSCNCPTRIRRASNSGSQITQRFHVEFGVFETWLRYNVQSAASISGHFVVSGLVQ